MNPDPLDWVGFRVMALGRIVILPDAHSRLQWRVHSRSGDDAGRLLLVVSMASRPSTHKPIDHVRSCLVLRRTRIQKGSVHLGKCGRKKPQSARAALL